MENVVDLYKKLECGLFGQSYDSRIHREPYLEAIFKIVELKPEGVINKLKDVLRNHLDDVVIQHAAKALIDMGEITHVIQYVYDTWQQTKEEHYAGAHERTIAIAQAILEKEPEAFINDLYNQTHRRSAAYLSTITNIKGLCQSFKFIEFILIDNPGEGLDMFNDSYPSSMLKQLNEAIWLVECVARSNEDIAVRIKAIQILSKYGLGSETLVYILSKDQEASVRYQAADSLGSNHLYKTAASALETTLRDQDVELRRHASASLSNMGDIGLDILIRAIQDPDKSVQEVALQELYKHANRDQCYPNGPEHDPIFTGRNEPDEFEHRHGRNSYKCKMCGYIWNVWDDE